MSEDNRRRLDFVIDNHTQWRLYPSDVSYFSTSGSFTTNPRRVAAKVTGPAGTIQDKLEATEGMVALISYDGPDDWKIVTYAEVPYDAQLGPIAKISWYSPDQEIGQDLVDVMSPPSFLPSTVHTFTDIDGNARKITITNTIYGNPISKATLTVDQDPSISAPGNEVHVLQSNSGGGNSGTSTGVFSNAGMLNFVVENRTQWTLPPSNVSCSFSTQTINTINANPDFWAGITGNQGTSTRPPPNAGNGGSGNSGTSTGVPNNEVKVVPQGNGGGGNSGTSTSVPGNEVPAVFQYGDRKLDFVIENHTQWTLSPSNVSYYATSGNFTTYPAAVACRVLGPKTAGTTKPGFRVCEGPAGTVQERRGATDGIVAIISYVGPDGWNIVTYAKVPTKAQTPPVTKISWYHPDQAINHDLVDAMSQSSFSANSVHAYVDTDGNARKITIMTKIHGNPISKATLTVNQNT